MTTRRTFAAGITSAVGASWLLPLTTACSGPSGDHTSDTDVLDGARSFTINSRYLNLPVGTGENSQHVKLLVDGRLAREFTIDLAEGEPQWWAFIDVGELQGQTVTLQIEEPEEGSTDFASVATGNEIANADEIYQESRRPQFHFSTRRGWLNDPNGLVYYDGEYHLFYQHGPFNWFDGHKHWGHAVSKDLVHWEELPTALYPDEHGAIWSGSAVVDENNMAGFASGDEKTIVAIYTAADTKKNQFTQAIAYSNDRGRTWKKYKNNPVVPKLNHADRDPKVFWYAPEGKWVMALYLDHVDWAALENPSIEEYLRVSNERNRFALFSSPDLRQWEKMSEIVFPGDRECAEFFEITVEGNADATRWIFYGAKGTYLIGGFDGTSFTPESGPHKMQHGDCFYASQTFNNIPAADGRRILIPWGADLDGTPWAGMLGHGGDAASPYKEMPFNQMMGLPVSLTLRETEEGLRIHSEPVDELKSLRTRSYKVKAQVLREGDNPLSGVSGELIEIETELSPGGAGLVQFDLRGIPVTYDAKTQTLSCAGKSAHLKLRDGKIRLRMMIDRTSIDIFGNDGALYMPMGMVVPEDNLSLTLYVEGGEAQIHALEVFELKSIWA